MHNLAYQPISGKTLESQIWTLEQADEAMKAVAVPEKIKTQDEVAKPAAVSIPSPAEIREKVLNNAAASAKSPLEKAKLGPVQHTKTEPSVTYREYQE